MTPTQSPAHQEIHRVFGEKGLECWKQLEGHLEAGAAILVLHLPASHAAICEQALTEFLGSRHGTHQSVQFQSEGEMLRAADMLADLSLDGIGAVWVNFIGSRPADDAWKKACGKALESLEESRQKIQEHVKVPIIFVGEHWLEGVFYEVARNLFSMRSMLLGLYTPSEDPYSGKPLPTGQRSFIGIDAASNPDYTLEQAKRLAGRKDLVTQRAELLLRTAAGYQQNGRLDLAESTLRMALAALQEVPATNTALAGERARVLAILAKTLEEMGCHRDAVAKAQDAERICRRLIKVQAGVFEFTLSGSLDVLARILGNMGRFDEGLPKAQEAVRIAEQLVKTKPGVYERAWGDAAQTLGYLLLKLGRTEEALLQAQEIERIYEPLAKAEPEFFEGGWARTLATLGEIFYSMGRLEEAASKFRQACPIFERLAKAWPAEFESQLAALLYWRSLVLGQLGQKKPGRLKAIFDIFRRVSRLTEAWESAERAVEIYQRLAKARPAEFEEWVAKSQCNFGERLYEARRMDPAWDNITAAIRIYERLAKTQPDAIEPSWARAMLLKRRILKATDSPETAAASTAAVKLLSRQFLQYPQLHAPLMVCLVQDYLADLKAMGHEPDRKLLGPILPLLEKLRRNQAND